MKIKAHTLFTDTHKKFLTDYFLPTFPFRKEIDLILLHREQHCKTAEFETEGWHETMRDKATCFLDGIQNCKDNEIFMFIDPDIQFFGDFYEDIINVMQTHDVAWQNDIIGGVNTGFFAVKNNKMTRNFFRTILGNLDSFSQEQVLANHLLQNIHKYPSIGIKWTFLPERYWTYGRIAALPGSLECGLRGHWTPESPDFDIPKDIVIHHANWTNSYQNKFLLLDLVKKKYNQNG
jgi:hypothetical protein